jgi:hypothetical protein
MSATTVIDKRIHFPSDWAPVWPEALEPIRRERRVAGRILDIAMPQLSLERRRIDAVIRQLKAAGLPQHVARNISANYAISATASIGASKSISARTGLSQKSPRRR